MDHIMDHSVRIHSNTVYEWGTWHPAVWLDAVIATKLALVSNVYMNQDSILLGWPPYILCFQDTSQFVIAICLHRSLFWGPKYGHAGIVQSCAFI